MIRFLSALVISIIFISGCETAEKQSSCRKIESKLRVCNMLTPGDFCLNLNDDVTLDCTAECIDKLSCGELTQYSCTTDLDDWKKECLSQCMGLWSCSNGEELTVPDPACDGFQDCMDGSDEMECPVFNCVDGSTVPLTSQCDGKSDCPDGSDEQNCPIQANLICIT